MEKADDQKAIEDNWGGEGEAPPGGALSAGFHLRVIPGRSLPSRNAPRADGRSALPWAAQQPTHCTASLLPTTLRRVWQPAALHAARERLHACVCAGERVGRRYVPGGYSDRNLHLLGLKVSVALPTIISGLQHPACRSRSRTFQSTCARGSRCALGSIMQCSLPQLSISMVRMVWQQPGGVQTLSHGVGV